MSAAFPLTPTQAFTLEWLGDQRLALYGECRGPDLDVLVNRDLAFVTASRPTDWDHVGLTSAGRRWRDRILAERLAQTEQQQVAA